MDVVKKITRLALVKKLCMGTAATTNVLESLQICVQWDECGSWNSIAGKRNRWLPMTTPYNSFPSGTQVLTNTTTVAMH